MLANNIILIILVITAILVWGAIITVLFFINDDMPYDDHPYDIFDGDE